MYAKKLPDRISWVPHSQRVVSWTTPQRLSLSPPLGKGEIPTVSRRRAAATASDRSASSATMRDIVCTASCCGFRGGQYKAARGAIPARALPFATPASPTPTRCTNTHTCSGGYTRSAHTHTEGRLMGSRKDGLDVKSLCSDHLMRPHSTQHMCCDCSW